MKEVTAVIKSNITVVYELPDDLEPLEINDIRKLLKQALNEGKAFVFDDIDPLKVKNFVLEENTSVSSKEI